MNSLFRTISYNINMEQEFELLNLLGIKMSNYNFHTIDQLMNDPFTVEYAKENNIIFNEEVVRKLLHKHDAEPKGLFKVESINSKLIVRLDEDFVDNFHDIYLKSYISDRKKSDLIIWLLYGNQFLFKSNILSKYQEFNIANSGTFNLFNKLEETNISNTYFDRNNSALYFVKHLQADHTSLNGNLRQRVSSGIIKKIVKYQFDNKIADFYTVSIYWSGDHPIFTVKKSDIHHYDEVISVDGRFQSFKIDQLLIPDNLLDGVVSFDKGSFRTRSKEQIVNFLHKEELTLIDKTLVTDVENKLAKVYNLKNYVSSFKSNISNMKHLREISLEKAKQQLIGLVGEFATINELQNKHNYTEDDIRWESEVNYGSNFDIEVIEKETSFKYEVKSTINKNKTLYISSREVDMLNIEPEHSYFVKVLIDNDCLEKYSELSDKIIWKDYITRDINDDLIKVEFNDWLSVRDNVEPYKYKININ